MANHNKAPKVVTVGMALALGVAGLAGCSSNANATPPPAVEQPTDSSDYAPADPVDEETVYGEDTPESTEQNEQSEATIDGLPSPESFVDKIRIAWGYDSVTFLGQCPDSEASTRDWLYVYECKLGDETTWTTVYFSKDKPEGDIYYEMPYNRLDAEE